MRSNGYGNWAAIAMTAVVTACGESHDFGETGETWELSSPVIPAPGADGTESLIPVEYTCEGREFPVPQNSPELTWTEGPKGTQSYAIVLKHLAISEGPASAENYFQGFMWALWDIPADVRRLPADISREQYPAEIPGAQQWASFNPFGYFAPCPNFDPSATTRVTDRYGFSLYALKTPRVDLPEAEEGTPNYVMPLALHLDATSLGMVQLNAASDAKSTTPPMPPAMVPLPITR